MRLFRACASAGANPTRWNGVSAPPYAAKSSGNAQQGLSVFGTFCASCHGSDGKGSTKVGSIVNPTYLSLITDQGLRTIVITGRPDFDAPDWRNNVPGQPMNDQEITDVVAWLAAQRPASGSDRFAGNQFFPARRAAVSRQ